jgi:serine/threonine-protein kinase ATR
LTVASRLGQRANSKMPQYRIEVSPNNRAGCKDKVCKEAGVKITKGEIRFGSWVEIKEHGSWAWKHWGCVSGAQMLNLHEFCDKGDGTFDFDLIDGYDEMRQVGPTPPCCVLALTCPSTHPELQEKVRRCVEQSHIDPEDFKGDPEKNKPGVTGIHLTDAQRAKLDQEKEKAAKAEADTDAPTPKTKAKAPAKRGRKKADADDEDDDEPPPKKAKQAKSSKKDDESPAPARPGRKAKTPVKKVKQESEDEDQEDEEDEDEEPSPAPAPKANQKVARKAKKEPEDEEESEKAAPAKKGRKAAAATTKKAAPAKRGRKAAADTPPESADEEEEEEEKPAPKPKARRGRPRKA